MPRDNFFVSDYIKGQVAVLDTIKYPFFKIETIDGKTDTSTITNTEAKNIAKEFIELPDISSENLRPDYDVSHLYDDLQEAFIFTYTTKENHPVQREDVTVEPQPNADNKNDIRSVYVDFQTAEENKSIRKNMLWDANKSFQITTTTDSPGTGQSIKRVTVIWKGFENLLK